MSAARYLYLEPLCQDLAGLLQGVDGIHIEHTTDVITLPMLQLLSLCGLSGDRGCPLITSELAKGLTCSLAERHWLTFTALIKSLNHVQLLLWQMGEMPQQISQCLWQSQRQVGRDNQPTTQVQRRFNMRYSAAASISMQGCSERMADECKTSSCILRLSITLALSARQNTQHEQPIYFHRRPAQKL